MSNMVYNYFVFYLIRKETYNASTKIYTLGLCFPKCDKHR